MFCDIMMIREQKPSVEQLKSKTREKRYQEVLDSNITSGNHYLKLVKVLKVIKIYPYEETG